MAEEGKIDYVRVRVSGFKTLFPSCTLQCPFFEKREGELIPETVDIEEKFKNDHFKQRETPTEIVDERAHSNDTAVPKGAKNKKSAMLDITNYDLYLLGMRKEMSFKFRTKLWSSICDHFSISERLKRVEEHFKNLRNFPIPAEYVPFAFSVPTTSSLIILIPKCSRP